ncbi:Protein-arginine-phosphatase [bacterium HR12]|nr:Protein-arginine-phosphatase [bacterium HR12]
MPGSILVVCTGNVCRSPIAEGFLRTVLEERLGDDAPLVASAGTAGWEGAPATPEAVAAAAELGVDIAGHRARALRAEHVLAADLVVTMTREQRDEVAEEVPAARARVFTLKELVRSLEAEPIPPDVSERSPSALARLADERRIRGLGRNPHDEDVVDPIGSPMETYRAVAWELQGWCRRLADLMAPAPARMEPGEG